MLKLKCGPDGGGVTVTLCPSQAVPQSVPMHLYVIRSVRLSYTMNGVAMGGGAQDGGSQTTGDPLEATDQGMGPIMGRGSRGIWKSSVC